MKDTIKTAILGTALLALTATGALAETRPAGLIQGDQVWDRDGSPYVLTEDLVIPKGSSLRVEKGVTLRFKPGLIDREGYNKYSLDLIVEGVLEVAGAEADSVYITTDADKPSWKDWQGIIIKEGGRADIEGAHLEFALTGILVDGGNLDIRNSSIQYCENQAIHFVRATGTVDRVTITGIGNVGGTGMGIWVDLDSDALITRSFIVGAQNGVVYSRSGTGTLEESIISLCIRNGVIIRACSPRIINNTISGNEYGVVLEFGSTPAVHNNNITENTVAHIWLKDYRREVVQVDLTNNFWGTTDLALIEDQILDGLDSEKVKAIAIVEPFLSEAFSGETGN